MTKLALSIFGTLVKEANVPSPDHWTLKIPKGMGKTVGLLGAGAGLGWQANKAIQDYQLGQSIRRQQGN